MASRKPYYTIAFLDCPYIVPNLLHTRTEVFAVILREKVEKTFQFGSVWDRTCNFGPLYSAKAFKKIEAQLKDSTAKGSRVILGGDINPGSAWGPNFCPPPIIVNTNAQSNMLFMKQETFGPIAFLVPFDTDEEVIKMANQSNAGLAAYFYTQNISPVWKVSEELETGMVGVRVGLISACEQPFSGVKESGIGRESGAHALDEYTDNKSITVGV